MVEKEEERCKHDWATVETFNRRTLLRNIPGVINIQEGTKIIYTRPTKMDDVYTFEWEDSEYSLQSSFFYTPQRWDIKNMVCLKCGECSDGKKVFVEKILEKVHSKIKHDKDMKERLELAVKMWEEGCKK